MRRIFAKISVAAVAFSAGITWGIVAEAAELGVLFGG